MTRAESRDENAEWYPYFLIKPDPCCPECVTIMDWRSAHRWIAITNGAEIRLSDYGWDSRHLHVREVREAHRKNRLQQLKDWESEDRCPVVLVASPALSSSSRPLTGNQSTYRKARRWPPELRRPCSR